MYVCFEGSNDMTGATKRGLKDKFTQKWKFCRYQLALMSKESLSSTKRSNNSNNWKVK